VKDESKQALFGVLLSLSGGSFRSNQVTSEDGTVMFTSLVYDVLLLHFSVIASFGASLSAEPRSIFSPPNDEGVQL
jgi:hypothetical protein